MRSLRSYLISMAISLVVLLSVGAGLLLGEFERAARDRAEKQLLDTTRALSSAIDGELRRAIGILETLRASDARHIDQQERTEASLNYGRC